MAPEAEPVSSRIAALVSVSDYVDRPALALADSETLSLGRHTLQWLDTPHVPHAWDCGLMMESSMGTFFCGNLFTRGGPGSEPLTESDILEPSEAFRGPLDYFAYAPQIQATLERLARLEPKTLACMHGSAWHGDGAALLKALADRLGQQPPGTTFGRPSFRRSDGSGQSPFGGRGVGGDASATARGADPNASERASTDPDADLRGGAIPHRRQRHLGETRVDIYVKDRGVRAYSAVSGAIALAVS